MSVALEFFGNALILGGVFFMVTGAIGVIRLPDVFARQHAAGMTDTGGAGLILTGLIFHAEFAVIVRLILILIFLLFTSPVATHAVCRAALHAGVKPLLGDEARR